MSKDILKGLRWKRNGRMMTEREWYGSQLHFMTEDDYSEYKKAYKIKYGKTIKKKPKKKSSKSRARRIGRKAQNVTDMINDMFGF